MLLAVGASTCVIEDTPGGSILKGKEPGFGRRRKKGALKRDL